MFVLEKFYKLKFKKGKSKLKNQIDEWNESYDNKGNFVFYPCEEIIRFVSKYIKKQVDLTNYVQKAEIGNDWLDLGCGIGRHVVYGNKLGFNVHGIDLSVKAVEFARGWAESEGVSGVNDKILQGDISKLPWDDCKFSVIVSHGVLDSMGYDIAKQAAKEAHRVLNADGFFYCDLISGFTVDAKNEFEGEQVVEDDHERNTIQSYFTVNKIKDLFSQYFDLKEVVLNKREDTITGANYSRYHVVMTKS